MFGKKIIVFIMLVLTLFFVPLARASFYQIDADIQRLMNVDASKTISMDFKGAKLNDVLKMFSQQSGMNFVVSSEIAEKQIDIYFDKVEVEQALERILTANDLVYELKPGSNIFIIKPVQKADKDVITKVYKLRFAQVPSSRLKSTYTISQDEGSGSSSEGSSSSGGAMGGSLSSGDSGSGASGSGLLSALKSVLTDKGTILEDPRTNSLIVSDIPSHFAVIDQVIASLDVSVPQVLIEAEMLDISKDTTDQMGVKFGAIMAEFNGASQKQALPFYANQDNSSFYGASRYTFSTLSFQNLSVALEFLRVQTDTKSLARPRIITLNNETAEIKITTQQVIGVSSTSSSTEADADTTEEAERYETGVSLNVTPQINLEDRLITLAIRPKVVQTRDTSISNRNGDILSFKDPEERGTKSTLRVRDGDTVVIGGLLRTDSSNVQTKVPLLHKIPIMGAAFRHKKIKGEERELVIFLTPHIMEDSLNPELAKADAYPQIVREQDIPKARIDYINRELGTVEKLGNY